MWEMWCPLKLEDCGLNRLNGINVYKSSALLFRCKPFLASRQKIFGNLNSYPGVELENVAKVFPNPRSSTDIFVSAFSLLSYLFALSEVISVTLRAASLPSKCHLFHRSVSKAQGKLSL